MTIICSIKSKGKVYLATDSYWGSVGNKDQGSSDTVKITEFKHFSVAISGCAAMRDACDELASKIKSKIKSKQDARNFSRKLFKKFKDINEDALVKANFEDVGFIIATESKIFKVYNNLSCFEVDQWTCDWTDFDAIMHATWAIYEPEELIQNALLIMEKMYPGYISGPFDIRLLTK